MSAAYSPRAAGSPGNRRFRFQISSRRPSDSIYILLPEINNPALPPTLYKFLSYSISASDSRIPFIETGETLRFSQPISFNDPFEALPVWTVDGLDDDLIELLFVGNTPLQKSLPYDKRRKFKAMKRASVKRRARENPEQLNRTLTRQAHKSACNVTGVLSLSATIKASPMWAHYAANHEGFCVGFNTSHHFFSHRKDNLVLKVEYTKERPVIPVTKFRDGLIEAVYESKDERWSYEEEYRLVKPLTLAYKKVGTDKKGFPVCLFKIPSEAVKEIVFGIDSSGDLKTRVIAWKERHPHVEIFVARVSERTYSVEKHPYLPES